MNDYEVWSSSTPHYRPVLLTNLDMVPQKEAKYIPAMNRTWLTPLYDPVLKWGMREETFKRYLVNVIHAQPRENILDLGCGTGTLTVMLKQSQPLVQLTGLDGDPAVLEIARKKAAAAQVEIEWQEGLAYQIPYPTGAFDKVVSSLMVHHLTSENKIRAFAEIYRVLKPGGETHILDFGQPHGPVMTFISWGMSHLEETRDHYQGRIPEMLQQGGFARVENPHRFQTIFGELSHFKTIKPE